MTALLMKPDDDQCHNGGSIDENDIINDDYYWRCWYLQYLFYKMMGDIDP